MIYCKIKADSIKASEIKDFFHAEEINDGNHPYDYFSIKKDGVEVNIKNPNDANALGIGMVHQHFKLIRTVRISLPLFFLAKMTMPSTGQTFFQTM